MTATTRNMLLALALGLTMPLAACDRDEGPVEEAAESIDEGMEEVVDELDDNDIIDN